MILSAVTFYHRNIILSIRALNSIIPIMKTYYSSSDYANYTHIHMYVFYDYFINELKRLNLDYEGSYSVDVNIDGNVAVWKIFIGDPQVEYVLNNLISNPDFINSKRIQKATKRVAEKMDKRFEIINSEFLLSEIRNIKLSTEKPNIKDNDSLSSPAIKFFANAN